MIFSGERYLSDLNSAQISYEHWHRYLYVSQFAKDKVVLDIACGEGYGANLIAQTAQRVVGVDISQEVIDFTKEHYSKDNLIFLQGSVDQIPIEGHEKFDVIVSFETIEHVNEELQQDFLKEVKRLLKSDGIFIVSTPNKLLYSDMSNYRNEYHIKEFYEQEFISFLSIYFENTNLLGQKIITGSNIWPLTCKDDKCYFDHHYLNKKDNKFVPEQHDEAAIYFIAICSDQQINVNYNSILIDKSMSLINEKNDLINLKHNDLNQVVTQNNLVIQEKEGAISKLDQVIQEKQKALAHKDQVIQEKEAALAHNKLVMQEKEAALAHNKLVMQEKEAILAHNNLVIQEKEEILDNIYRSGGWKLLVRYYRFRDLLFPDHTKRKLFAKLLINFMRNPGSFIKDINLKNVKILFSYLRKENIDKVDIRIEKYLLKYENQPKMELLIYENKEIKDKLFFPEFDDILVSIVIPVYNQWDYTYSCLQAILENTREINYEIIIADDLSSDETINIASYLENINVVRNQTNLGFLRNCNNAAKNARGKYILFLNNDTNVQKDWLKYLVELIERDSTIGMVGSKLVYPDGRLQEAGGIIWSDASGWNYGRLDDPEKPEYNYVKEVDYISGACIMIKTDLWRKIGGFDERYVPAYYEDSDMAFEIRKLGFKVVFQPKSIVVHFEGISNGTDTNSGIKSYQVKNMENFLDKWKYTLDKEHFENANNLFLARDRSANKKTILVIDHYVPHYDQDAGGRSTFQYLKLFVEMGFNVKFLGDNFYKHEPYTTILEQMGIEVLYGVWYRDNYEKWIKNNATNINYVYLNRPHISIKYIELIRTHTNAKILYFGHDLHYLREQRQAQIEGNQELLKSSEQIKKIEMQVISRADIVYYPSIIEIEEIKKQFPDIKAKVLLAWMYERIEWSNENDFEKRKDLLFVGGFSHPPNLDGVLWFLKEIYPNILKHLPDIRFFIVGSNPPEQLLKLKSENIIITGYVSDLELSDYYNKCRLVVVPLRYGAGVKGKVVEAMYYQLPVITTSIGAEGIEDIEKTVIVEDEAKAFSERIIEIYNDYSKLNDMSKKSVEYINNYYSTDVVKANILKDFHDL